MKSTIILAVFFSFFAMAEPEKEIRTEVSAPKYLYFSWWVRREENDSLSAQTKAKTQPNTAEFDKFMGETWTDLYKKGSVSEEEALIFQTLQKNSQLDIANTQDNALRTAKVFEMFVTQRGYSKGDVIQLDEIYKISMGVWDAQCRQATREIQNAQNEVDLRTYLFEKNKKLFDRDIVTLRKLTESEANYKKALAGRKAANEWARRCPQDIPTFEFLRQISQPQPLILNDSPSKQKVQVSPPAYLSFYDFARSMRIARDEFRILLARKKVETEFLYREYLRQKHLFEKNVHSERVYRDAKFLYETALIDAVILQNQIGFYEASKKINEIQMQFAEGKPASLKEMYVQYEKFWDADCTSKKKNAEKSHLKAAHKKWLEQILFKLRETDIGSKRNYLYALMESKNAEVEAEYNQRKSDHCRDDVPSFEFLENIKRPEPPSMRLFAEAPPKNQVRVPANAPGYLMSFWFAHDKIPTEIKQARKIDEFAADVEAGKLFVEIDEDLFRKGHGTEVKYLETKLQFETDQLKLEQSRFALKQAIFDRESAFLSLSWAGGVKPDLRKLFDLKMGVYENECQAESLSLKIAQKNVEFRQIIFNKTEELHRRGNISERIFELRQAELQKWKDDLVIRREMVAGCQTDIPTWDYVSQIKSILPD